MVGGDGKESGAGRVRESQPREAGPWLMTLPLLPRILSGGTSGGSTDVGRGEGGVLDWASAGA